jgi:hypothetical protein
MLYLYCYSYSYCYLPLGGITVAVKVVVYYFIKSNEYPRVLFLVLVNERVLEVTYG